MRFTPFGEIFMRLNLRSATPWLRLPALLFLAGCYRYSAFTETTPHPASHVRLTLASPPSPAVRSRLGDGTVAVEGRVITASDSAYTLGVAATLKQPFTLGAQNRLVWSGESVTIPRSAVSGTEVRSLDRGRTSRAIALGTVVALVTVKLIVSAIGSNSGGDDGGTVVTPP